MSVQTKKNYINLVFQVLVLLILSISFASAAMAQGGGSSGSGGSSGGAGGGGGNLDEDSPNDATRTGAIDVREDYRRANKLAIPFGPPTRRNSGGLDIVKDRESQGPGTVDHGPGPVYAWPVVIPTATSAVPTKRDMGIMKNRLQTFGLPVSDTQYQMIHRMDQQILLEEMFDPERVMWLGACIGSTQAQDTSNSCANMIRNQSASAIDYVSQPISNFTVDKNNKWNKIRDQLFMPMAVLLLLPGAMLAQVKVIVAAGMPLGDAQNPFEGIIRSIVAIFLIPATYLVVNYGIDINNSLTKTISDGYTNEFHSNMYKDALCFMIRAFPIRQAQENRNGIYKEVVPWADNSGAGGTPASGLESRSLKVKVEDPCAGVFITDPNRSDEQAPFLSVGQRLIVNGSNAVLAMTWNILCAFQVVFLMYLWMVGPVVAALWVYPLDALRSALPGWIEGVITLCFWALFWNTSILLMACFKGVDSTGTILASALLFLCVQSVKSAFDFAGLVKEAGEKAGDAAAGATQHMGGKAKTGAAGGKTGSGGAGAGGGGGRIGGVALSHAGKAGGAQSAGSTATTGGRVASHDTAPSIKHGDGGFAVRGTIPHGETSGSAAHTGLASHGQGHGQAVSDRTQAGAERAQSGAQGQAGSDRAQTGGDRAQTGGDHTQAGERGGSAADRSGILASSSPSTPPLTHGPADININNSSSSSLSQFSSFNAGSLTGTVGGKEGSYSAKEAASLIGQNNLANFPREGALMNKEQAQQAFMNASREVDKMNLGGGPDAAKRNDLMAGWKDELLKADQKTSPDGSTIGADPMSTLAAGGNWNLTGGAAAAGTLPQAMDGVFTHVGAALNDANAALGVPGGMPVNPQAVEGLNQLAREMTQVGPQLAGMTPQTIGATVESWQQRADVLQQQMFQPSATPVSQESFARMQVETQQSAASLSQFQQSYQGAAGPPGGDISYTAYSAGGGNAGYSASGGDPSYGQAAAGSYMYPSAAGGEGAYGYGQPGGGYSAGNDSGYSAGAGYSSGSGGEAGYAQPGYGTPQSYAEQSGQASGYPQQGADPSQTYSSSTGSPPGASPEQYYQQSSGYYPQGDPSSSGGYPGATNSADPNYQSPQGYGAAGYYQGADGGYYYQQPQSFDQNTAYQQQPQSYDQNAAYQQQQQSYDQNAAYQQQPQSYDQNAAYQQQPQSYDQNAAYQQQPQSYDQNAAYQQQQQAYDQNAAYQQQPQAYDQNAAYQQQQQPGYDQSQYMQPPGYEQNAYQQAYYDQALNQQAQQPSELPAPSYQGPGESVQAAQQNPWGGSAEQNPGMLGYIGMEQSNPEQSNPEPQHFQQPEQAHAPEYGSAGGGYIQQPHQQDNANAWIAAANSAANRPAPDKPPPAKPVDAQKPPAPAAKPEEQKRMQSPLNFIKKPDAKKKKPGDEDGPPPLPPKT